MNKTREVILLDAFIEKLGPHSYLGPWLADNRESIVADIHNDLPVDILLPGAARRRADAIVADAHAAAKVIRDSASAAADTLRRETQKACDERRGYVATLIERAASEAVGVLSGRR